MYRNLLPLLLFCPLGIKRTQAETGCHFSLCIGHRGPFPERNVRGHPALIRNSCISTSWPMVKQPLILARILASVAFLLPVVPSPPCCPSCLYSPGDVSRKDIPRCSCKGNGWFSLALTPFLASLHSSFPHGPRDPSRPKGLGQTLCSLRALGGTLSCTLFPQAPPLRISIF